MPSFRQWRASEGRQVLYASLRELLRARGYREVETPALVPAPGMEPHIDAFSVPFQPSMVGGQAQTRYLQTSPEYAMKRLLADGSGPIFQICKAFRNGELSRWHNPEFTLLELYRPDTDYSGIMQELEEALAASEASLSKAGFPAPGIFGRLPFERITARQAFLQEAGIDLDVCPDADSLRAAAVRAGIQIGKGDQFDDLFFRVLLERIEPKLGMERPSYLMDYPASMAALARLKPDRRYAERFELYARGIELANGFSELTDADEQRRRLIEEQGARRAGGKPVYALDEAFLSAVSKMPPCAGVAVGLDRVLMLLLGAESIEDVLLFPAKGV